jgi:hypothetical protein
VRYFGAPEDAPVYESTQPAPTPVDEPCMSCEVAIECGDQGFLIPSMVGSDNGRERPWHRLCFLSEVVGPLKL